VFLELDKKSFEVFVLQRLKDGKEAPANAEIIKVVQATIETEL